MHVPHFEQERDYSCLAACVRMVLAFYGVARTEAELRTLLKTRPGGTSPVQAMWRLPDIGFDAYVQTGSRAMLYENLSAGRPCIVHVWTRYLPHWTDEVIHAVVVADMTASNVLIHDPVRSSGPTEVPMEDFIRAWAATDYLVLVIERKE